ncbi:MAG: hypothetical protein GEV12_17790 [Micromonosporaceae bacterium]|nr:hypothetical protein [Micromonosporaceae bacterium]
MLNGRTVVFLSCSERFRATVAEPIRAGLTALGYHAVIVSQEPRLLGADWTPDAKVQSYMDASDALVALCTADNRLDDDSMQTRPNIIDEIQRARSTPRLRDKIMVLKAPDVRLPSNINPVYEDLDLDDTAAAIEKIRIQLRAWNITPVEPSSPSPSIPAAPAIPIEQLTDGLALGDDDRASARAYQLALKSTLEAQRDIAAEALQQVAAARDDTDIHITSSLIEAMGRIDPNLVPLDRIAELATSAEVPKRIAAIFVLWDLAEAAPGLVPLGIVGRLAKPAEEDWYVEAPAMAVTKLLMLHRRHARVIFDHLAGSADATDRHDVAAALLNLAAVDVTAVPPDLAQRLSEDADDLVAAKASEVVAAIAHLNEDAYRRRFMPFGI